MTEAALVARSRRLGPAFDLLANYRDGADFFFERSGLGISAMGAAGGIGTSGGPGRIARLAARAEESLKAIRRGEEGPPPVAVGAIPFDDLQPAMLVIPERTVGRGEDGETWQLDVWAEGLAPADEIRGGWTGRAAPHDEFQEFQLKPEPAPEAYMAAVDRARAGIRAGDLRKVVLARSLIVRAGRQLDAKQLLWRLRAVDPECFAFAAPTFTRRGGELLRMGALVGATPELLVARTGRHVRCTPLAGSAPRHGDRAADRASAELLRASPKEREEHDVVVQAVAEGLHPFCLELEYAPEPELLPTANVWHLATPFRGRLREPAPSVLELVAALHPTPAVCGTPSKSARAVIAELEPFDRGCYAGPVGWVDAAGDGEWAIALRCAELAGSVARLFAGAGIVAGSIPGLELEETEAKFRALLDSLRWG
ncbi:MAG: isochorismate synthase [Actinomycetota bacterium]